MFPFRFSSYQSTNDKLNFTAYQEIYICNKYCLATATVQYEEAVSSIGSEDWPETKPVWEDCGTASGAWENRWVSNRNRTFYIDDWIKCCIIYVNLQRRRCQLTSRCAPSSRRSCWNISRVLARGQTGSPWIKDWRGQQIFFWVRVW